MLSFFLPGMSRERSGFCDGKAGPTRRGRFGVSSGWLDFAAQRADVVAVALFRQSTDLLVLEFRDFLRPAPDDCSSRFVGLKHELDTLFRLVAEYLEQYFDHELHAVMVIIEQDHVVRRKTARPGFLARLWPHSDSGFFAHGPSRKAASARDSTPQTTESGAPAAH